MSESRRFRLRECPHWEPKTAGRASWPSGLRTGDGPAEGETGAFGAADPGRSVCPPGGRLRGARGRRSLQRVGAGQGADGSRVSLEPAARSPQSPGSHI